MNEDEKRPPASAIRDEELERGAAILQLVELVEAHGVQQVHNWIRNIAHAQGKDVCIGACPLVVRVQVPRVK